MTLLRGSSGLLLPTRVPGPLGASCYVVASDALEKTRRTALILKRAGYNVFLCSGTDDDQTIGEAVQALKSGMGGLIQLSEGNLYFSAPVDYYALLSAWTGSVLGKLTIQGQGPESTIIHPSGAIQSLFKLDELTKTIRHIQHKDFGMVDTSGVVTGGGIFLDDADVNPGF